MTTLGRNSALIGLGLSLAPLTMAMNIGPLEVKSTQGEPMRAEVVISDVSDKEAPYILASVATKREHQQVGLEYNQYADFLKTFSRRISNDKVVISIISTKPINEADLELALRLNDGTQSKIYSLSAAIPKKAEQGKNTQAIDVSNVTPLASSSEEIPLEVQTVNSLPPIAETVETDTTAANANLVDQNIKPTHVKNTKNTVQDAKIQNTTAKSTHTHKNVHKGKYMATAQPKTGHARAGKYVVQPNDTLWQIANRMAKQNHVTTQQALNSIYNNNPKAFVNGDEDKLRVGVNLILPKPAQMAHASQKTKVKTALQSTNEQVKHNNTAVPKSEMKLVAPSKAAGKTEGAKISEHTTVPTSQVPVANKPLPNSAPVNNQTLIDKITASHQRSLSLYDQLQQMGSKITDNQRQIAIRSAKLADLQKQLAERNKAAQAK